MYENNCMNNLLKYICLLQDNSTNNCNRLCSNNYNTRVLQIYKKNGDFIVCRDEWMICPFNHADGIEYDDEENELFKISTIVAGLLGVAKTSLCESIDYLQSLTIFLN